MDAAEMLFADQGFNGTSVRDISEKANVNLAMISYYFGSKEKLLGAIFEYRQELSKLKLESIINDSSLSSLDKMNVLIDHYIDKVIGQQCFHRIMVREQVLANNGHLAELMMQMKKTNQELVNKLIQQGQRRGEFRKNIDIPLMIATMVGTTSHLVTSKYYYKELNNLQSLSDEELMKHIRKKLSHHLKNLFKIILTHDL